MSVAELFAGHDLAVSIGIGTAVSVGGVMLVEYLALSRLVHAVTSWDLQRVVGGIGIALVVVAPITLLDPERFYYDLLKPSLIALWLSQLVVFAVFPRFAARRGARPAPAWALAAGSAAFAVYGLWATVRHATG
jgi:hypothetical protein